MPERIQGTTGCDYADGVLLPSMRQLGQFVDQEGFGAAESPPIGGDPQHQEWV
jgi:hypothetical protein